MKTKFITAAVAAGLLFLGFAEKSSALTIVDDRTWSGTQCGPSGGSGSGDCYGLTYHLVINDANDANATTFAATVDVTGTYTGSLTYIGAVDFKGGNVTSASLTGAPGNDNLWVTSFNNGQAATNCLNGNGGFLCSYDSGTNTEAPLTNPINYQWSWDFALNGSYTFGHFGVNFTTADDSCTHGPNTLLDCADGINLSVDGGGTAGGPGGAATTATSVPEPSTFLMLGSGLLVLARSVRKKRGLS